MSHASYQVISATNLHPIPRSQRRRIPKLLQQERVVKTITRILSALNAKSTIVAFATVCKSLTRPVLDVLWEFQDDWFQLLKCFPPDVWEDRDNAFVSCHSFALTYSLFISLPALPPQSHRSGMGSPSNICFEDGPYERHAVAKIHIDPLLPNLEYGSQQLPIISQTSDPELENGMGFRPVHIIVPLA